MPFGGICHGSNPCRTANLPEAPNSRRQLPGKHQASRIIGLAMISEPGVWSFSGGWCLEFGSFFPKLPPMSKPDQLRELWRMQDALNQRIGVNTHGMTEAEKTKWILNYSRAMTQEIAELTDSVPWKWWAKYQKFDEQNARVEVVDLFHFLISLAQVLGMSADDVFNAYCKKNEVNFKRQDSGYAQKDHEDSRHI